MKKGKLFLIILLFIISFFLGILFPFNIPFKYKESKITTLKNNSLAEVYVTPIPFTNKLKLVDTLVESSDLNISYMTKSKFDNLEAGKAFLTHKTIKAFLSGRTSSEELIDILKDSDISLITENSLYEFSFNQNNIAFFYIDADNLTSVNLKSIMDVIKNKKNLKKGVVVYISSSAPISDILLTSLSECGTTVILNSSYNKEKFKRINNTLVINDCNDDNLSYIPQLSFAFYDKQLVAIGVKLIFLKYSDYDNTLEDVRSKSPSLPFIIGEKFNFIEF